MIVEELKEKLQREAEKAHIRLRYKSTVCASVGSGKSKIAINRINEHYSNNSDAKIIFSGAREIYLSTFKNELVKWGLEDKIENITFCCVASLKNWIDEDWNLVIIDEAHLDVDRILSFIQNFKNTKCEILLLTGTPIGENTIIGKELYKICPISYSKKIDESIEDSLINDYQITIIRHELSDIPYIKYGNVGFQSEKQKYAWLYKCYLNSFGRSKKKFSFELTQLKLFFKNLRTKKEITQKLLEHIRSKVLIYAGSIDQAESLNKVCYHSKLHKKERELIINSFIRDEIRELVNVAGIRESVNIPNLKYGVVMAPDASRNGFEQTVGRFSRLIIGNIAHIFVLCTKNTIEESWVNNAIKELDSAKIKKINFEEIEDIYQ